MKKILAMAAILILALAGCNVIPTGPTEHTGNITANETWEPSGNPHIVKSNISVENNATLTIKPGCIVRFDVGTDLYCGYNGAGAIVAKGTADSLITFSSNVASPSPGDWEAIEIYKDAMSTTSFEYCTIEYGGNSDSYGSFYIENFGLPMNNCTIRKSGSYGIRMTGDGFFKTFNSNIITECAKHPIYISPEYIRTIGTGNGFTGNTKDGILVGIGKVTTTGTWPDLAVPYEIEGNVSIEDNSNTPTITIGPGATLKMQNAVEIQVGYNAPGGLIADGTVSRITFTSAVTPSAKGDWMCISFFDKSIDANCRLKNCKLEYGGNGDYGNIYIADALPEITGDSIGHSTGYGIYVTGSEYPDTNTLRSSNTFYDNDLGDVGP